MLDIFSLNHGRLSLVARGGNSAKSPLKAQLQPFQPLLIDWQGRADLKTLTQVEPRHGPQLASTEALYCGFYINELVQRLLPPQEVHQPLFACYIETLNTLAASRDFEPVLRRFEQAFADAVGYGFAWDQANDLGQLVAADGHYYYDPEQGILAEPAPGARLQGLPGSVLLALAADDLSSPTSRRLAKRVMRVLIDHLLQGRPLHSRNLFTHWRGDES